MSRQQYTFWYGRGLSTDQRNNESRVVDWLQQDVRSLQQNTMITPLYIDGAGWDDRRHPPNTKLGSLRRRGARSLLQALGDNTSVTKFLFQNATLDENLDRALTQAMAANQSLESVSFRNLTSSNTSNQNNVAAAATTPRRYALPATVFGRHNANLRTLHLSNVLLDAAACDSLARQLRDPQSQLATLTLQNVLIATDGGLEQVLTALTTPCTQLTTLKLINMMVPQEQQQQQQQQQEDDEQQEDDNSNNKALIHRWLRALVGNRSITTLHLEGMQLDATDAPDLAALLQTNHSTLQQLSLRRNLLTAPALRTMFFATTTNDEQQQQQQQQGTATTTVPQLHPNLSLQRLYLSRNCLGDDSAPLLAELIRQTTSLQELCLVDCKLTSQACPTIAGSLQHNHNNTLQSIALDGNAFDSSTQCATLILQALEQHNNTTLRHVLDQMPALLARQQQQQGQRRSGSNSGRRGSGRTNRLHELWSRVDLLLRANRMHKRAALPQLWKNDDNDEDGYSCLNHPANSYLPHLLKQTPPDVLHYLLRDGGIVGQCTFTASPETAHAKMERAAPWLPLLLLSSRQRPRRIVPSVA
mmetsp:Transcript_1096/g.2141  ORF Transcript_1096/g.2141 Transcript_1096/m.2141 type:complete len:586 (-) Transcript_1096:120-1877(-)